MDRTTVGVIITFSRLEPAQGRLLVYDNINQLKLKAGYGLNGSDVGAEYASTIIGGRSYTFGRNEPNKRYNTCTGNNPDLRWESVAQLNVGAEIRAYDYLVFGFDVFNRKTNDMKTRPPLPDYIGNDPSRKNVGSVEPRYRYGIRLRQNLQRTLLLV